MSIIILESADLYLSLAVAAVQPPWQSEHTPASSQFEYTHDTGAGGGGLPMLFSLEEECQHEMFILKRNSDRCVLIDVINAFDKLIFPWTRGVLIKNLLVVTFQYTITN